MRKHFTLTLLITTTLFLLTACNKGDVDANIQGTEFTSSEINTQLSDTEEITSTESTETPELLQFVDAWGEWHEFEVNSSVEKHPYNWEYLSNNESNISYEGDENYRIRHGVDVSKWQGNIDWNKVKAAGYDFAIIRLGYRGYSEAGGLELDSKFYQNLQGAQAAGLDVGVYFFSQAINETEALEEANFVLEALEGYSLQLPIVYDPELIRDMDARTDNVTGEQFTKNTIVFCEAIIEAGFKSMIYSNMIWEAFLFDMEELQIYPFWYADYESVPQTPYNFVMWQYTETGRVDGISEMVDLNIMFEPIE